MELDGLSIKAVKKEVDKRKQRLKKIDKILQQALKTGQLFAKMSFDSAEDGRTSVQIVKVSENKYELQANGDDVCFLEFGAGTAAGDSLNKFVYENIPVEVYPGSWSQSEQGAGWFKPGEREYWQYGDKAYDHIMPLSGMGTAYAIMYNKIQREIAKLGGKK